MKKISIVGLGHIGLPLADKLQKDFEVVGTVSHQEKKTPHIYSLYYTTNGEVPDELESDITVLTIPPSGLDPKNFPKFKTKWLIYTSSISVYGTHQGIVSESTTPTPDDDSGKKLLMIEAEVKKYPNWSILRLGGLIGETRHPGKYLVGKTNLANPLAPVNLIHHDDVVQIIVSLIQKQKTNEIYNCVCDDHHTREDFYTSYARKHNLALPEFQQMSGTNYKMVLNDKIKQHLGIEFIYSELIEKSF